MSDTHGICGSAPVIQPASTNSSEEVDQGRQRKASMARYSGSSRCDTTKESEEQDDHTGNTSTIWRTPFPLREIGALCKPALGGEEPLSPLQHIESFDERPDEPLLTVYGEFRGDADSAQLFPLRQPSNSASKGASESLSSVECQPVRRPNSHIIHGLIRRAQAWLIHCGRDNREAPLSASIYWAIRSLRFVYARQILQVERQGALPLDNREDDDWPEPPSEEDTFDWNMVPLWLYTLLTMDGTHEWGLRREGTGNEHRLGEFVSQWYNMADLTIAAIPERELDDPPDQWESESASGSSMGLIVEISEKEGEGTNSDTT